MNFLGVLYFFRLKILARKSKKPSKSWKVSNFEAAQLRKSASSGEVFCLKAWHGPRQRISERSGGSLCLLWRGGSQKMPLFPVNPAEGGPFSVLTVKKLCLRQNWNSVSSTPKKITPTPEYGRTRSPAWPLSAASSRANRAAVFIIELCRGLVALSLTYILRSLIFKKIPHWICLAVAHHCIVMLMTCVMRIECRLNPSQ